MRYAFQTWKSPPPHSLSKVWSTTDVSATLTAHQRQFSFTTMSNEADDLSFVALFPLPFRVLFLVGLGLFGWATNLHGLSLLGIDAAGALELRSAHDDLKPLPMDRQHAGFKFVQDPSTYYAPLYRLSALYASFCFLTWTLYYLATQGNIAYVDPFKFIPALCTLCVLIVLISPYNVVGKRERDAFFSTIRRCLVSPASHPVYFSDVIFADVFTSFAKIYGDLWLSLCMLLPSGSLLALPSQDGLSRWVLPILMSLPYLVRLRQCVIEYAHPSNESRRPLFNALKYASSFPVIFLSAAQRIVVSELIAEKGDQVIKEAWHGEHPLFRLWLLVALVNSVYSFWWDVTNDWGFDLLRPAFLSKPARPQSLPRELFLPALHERSESLTSNFVNPSSSPSSTTPFIPRPSRPKHTFPFGLRPTLLFPLPIYPFVIFLDLVLRLTWGIKLSSHLHAHMQGEGSAFIFWIEIAEIVRRWAWVFVRVEWEIVRRSQGGRARWAGSGDGQRPVPGRTRSMDNPDASDEDVEDVDDESFEKILDAEDEGRMMMP
ncbi:hypothetical protein EW146_g4365 [Bondarzewia mesenterica]|uniref:EXS domain-containing protein n=1 Tax=Bondarzewia mesenterica TaxID=1095465 RepID=A0A4S4LUT7_9AGAM|nr:hypothetical protein EW146_g4365 [Bondarzewia mesenterica]